MPKRSRSQDENQAAFNIVQKITGEPMPSPSKADISRIMAHMGRRGGLKGGKARAQSLSASDRKAIAQKAARARWSEKNKT